MATLRERSMEQVRRLPATIWVLIACSILVLPGFARAMLQNRASEFRMHLIHGEPVVARFVCGTDSGLDCRAGYTISYSIGDSRYCEHVERNGTPVDAASRCDSNPARGGLSIAGTLYTYDRLGVVSRDSRYVGQLFLP
jgi:hypothetical protein